MIRTLNDGTSRPPALRCYFNLLALDDLPESSEGPHGLPLERQLEAIAAAGYEGVQFAEGGDAAFCRRLGLGMTGSGRVNTPEEADVAAARLADLGHACATLHVGWGTEDDAAAGRLLDAVLAAQERRNLPLYVETHRATVFQDMWRTVQFLRRFPDLGVNADFSHWYTGQEMWYGGVEEKVAFFAPVFPHVRFMHGRIGNPGRIQVDIGDGDDAGRPHVTHFRLMWTRCFEAFKRDAGPGDYLVFAPELLAPRIFYAATFPGPDGRPREEGDRWTQSLLYAKLARQWFDAAAR